MMKGHQRLKARWLTSMVSSRSRSEQSLREWASVGVSTHSGRELSLRVLRNLMILDVQCVNWTVVLAYIIIAIKQIGGINVLFKFWMLKIQIFQHLRNFFLLHLLKWSRFVTQKVLYHLYHLNKNLPFHKNLPHHKNISYHKCFLLFELSHFFLSSWWSLHPIRSDRGPKGRGSDVLKKSFQLISKRVTLLSSSLKEEYFFVEKQIQQIQPYLALLDWKTFQSCFSLYFKILKQ